MPLVLGTDEAAGGEKLLPIRMLNEFAYCPRLFFLEYVQGEFADNEFTVHGRSVHSRVDAGGGSVPEPESKEERPFTAKSVSLSSDTLGLSAKIDIVEGDGSTVCPVDYKRGRPPQTEEGAYEPERIQLCAYGLLLRENGYVCEKGILYFAQARRRVEIEFDAALVARTKELIVAAKALADSSDLPPPLVGDPKCERCSLNAICLPDELTMLRAPSESGERRGERHRPRQVVVPQDDAAPLYVQTQGARLGIDGAQLRIRDHDGKTLLEKRFPDISQVVVYGNVQVSAQVLRELFERGIPVCWMSFGGWLSGFTEGLGHGNIELRRAQFRLAEDARFCVKIARRLVRNKIQNSRTLLRRNHVGEPEAALRELQRAADAAEESDSAESLLGIEGNAARVYFQQFTGMLKGGAGATFDFETRNRRPPKDPVNALLSLAYSLLAKDMMLAVRAVGLDPFLGFFHRIRHGRPALALDLMEDFRPLIGDSVVLNVLNTGVVGVADFVRTGIGMSLKPDARRNVIAAYERRMREEIQHPVFEYRVSYRRALMTQARLFARFLQGEIDSYPEFRTR